MTTRYLIERIGSKYRATCAELGVWAFGPTVEHAVSALRRRIANLRQRGTSC